MESMGYLMDCLGIMPMLILFLTGVAVLMMDAFSPTGRKGEPAYVSLLGAVAALVVTLTFTVDQGSVFGGMVYADRLARFFHVILLAGTILVILLSQGILRREAMERGEYYALVLWACTGMMLMAAAANFIVLFLGLETLSIAVYVLVGFPRHRREANEASLKYFLLGAFASGFFLYGMTFLYGATGTLRLEAIGDLLGRGEVLHNAYLLLGSALLLVGFAFKMALVPFHLWTPDVYEGAPTPITAFMAVGVKAAVFAALMRSFGIALPAVEPHWIPVFWGLAALTMTVGNIVALVQDSVKRLLAYSSIAHAGYILVAVVAGSGPGYTAMLVYLLVYTFMNVGAFGVMVFLQERTGVGERIEDYRGLGFRQPMLGLVMAIFLFSLAGVPPTAGFVAKFYVFAAAMKAGWTWLVVVALVNSVVAAYYYLRVVIAIYSKEGGAIQATPIPRGSSGTAASIGALVVALWVTIHVGVFPEPVWEAARSAVAVLF